MKFTSLVYSFILLITSSSVTAAVLSTRLTIPDGTYHLQQAICQNGVVLDMGWPMVTVNQTLTVKGTSLHLISHIKKRSMVPYNIDCSIESSGSINYNEDASYDGSLTKTACSCTVSKYEERTCARKDGEYEYETTLFDVSENGKSVKLTRADKDPYQKYCAKKGSDLPPTLVFSK